eukprot:m.76522 g.76522  ORF g.76522 m.76522 type:complete len:98 (+) comp12563_c0_seq2:937-1230(+)
MCQMFFASENILAPHEDTGGFNPVRLYPELLTAGIKLRTPQSGADHPPPKKESKNCTLRGKKQPFITDTYSINTFSVEGTLYICLARGTRATSCHST